MCPICNFKASAYVRYVKNKKGVKRLDEIMFNHTRKRIKIKHRLYGLKAKSFLEALGNLRHIEQTTIRLRNQVLESFATLDNWQLKEVA